MTNLGESVFCYALSSWTHGSFRVSARLVEMGALFLILYSTLSSTMMQCKYGFNIEGSKKLTLGQVVGPSRYCRLSGV